MISINAFMLIIGKIIKDPILKDKRKFNVKIGKLNSN